MVPVTTVELAQWIMGGLPKLIRNLRADALDL